LPKHGADLELLSLGRLRRPVAQRYVRHLVRHDAGNLALSLGSLDHSSIEEHRPAGQRERVDLFLIHHVEGVAEFLVLKLRWNGGGECPPDRLDVILGPLIVQKGQLFRDLGGRLPAKFHIVGKAVAVLGRDDPGLCAGKRQRTGDAQPNERSFQAWRRHRMSHAPKPLQVAGQPRIH
jgi:hypothetical protein